MGHSEVNLARLLPSGDVEIQLVLPNSAKGAPLVITAIVTQDAAGGATERAVAHTSYLFTPGEDGQAAVFTVARDPAGRPFDPKVGIEARATTTYACWSSLDGAAPGTVEAGWTWELGEWA